MFRTTFASLVLTGLLSSMAVAEDCGRWVECSVDHALSTEDFRSYIYGERREVEPWIKDVQKDEHKEAKRTIQAPALGAGSASQDIRLIEDVASENEARFEEENDLDPVPNPDVFPEDNSTEIINLTPQEEAAMRAYLAEVDAGRQVESDFIVGGNVEPTALKGVRVISTDGN